MSELLKTNKYGLGFRNDWYSQWRNSGLLEGIETKDGYRLAYLYETMAYYLKSGNKFDTFKDRFLLCEKTYEKYDKCKIDSKVVNVIFPIIRRVYSKNDNKIFNIFDCLDKFIIIFRNIKFDELADIKGVSFVPWSTGILDAEATSTAWFCDYYLDLINSKKDLPNLLEESKEFRIKYIQDFIVETSQALIIDY